MKLLIKTRPTLTFTKLLLSENIYHTFTGLSHSKKLGFDSVIQIQASASMLHYTPVTSYQLATHYGMHKIKCTITPDSYFIINGSHFISEYAASIREEHKLLWNKLTWHGNFNFTHTQCHMRCLNLTDNDNQIISIPFSDKNLPNIDS